MRLFLKLSAIGLLLCQVSFAYAEDQQDIERRQAREIIQKFQKSLKSELQSAMKSGGPIHAVSVCHEKAPEIAKNLSLETGWDVGRTSLKARNTVHHPNDAVEGVLKQFEIDKQSGTAMADMEWLGTLEGRMTYIKPIATQPVCTICHGQNINPKLKQHIDGLYPHDMATGFEVGDIRGAFILQKQEEAE